MKTEIEWWKKVKIIWNGTGKQTQVDERQIFWMMKYAYVTGKYAVYCHISDRYTFKDEYEGKEI